METDGKLALIVPYMSLWHERVKYVRLNTSLLMELIGVEYYLKTLHVWYSLILIVKEQKTFDKIPPNSTTKC